ncbi:L-ribulose-5-phosphate 3-epimerase UlaE [Stieleria bergensis]|uniref:L-ribulose-5-phosphate 3-epimerase UlaE n=1 Tax=Stieleria bergensis TaxID=2528025 RepID=A0A517SRE6_9BACT|nr:L-ribulose-5-phosphate 3-epimerase UlaE [Planctomycetes bacterium SV_7m_r]
MTSSAVPADVTLSDQASDQASDQQSGGQVSRRQIVGFGSAVALSTLAWPRRDVRGQDLGASDGQRCLLGFSTYGMPSVKTEQAIEVLGQIGYDSVELCVRKGVDADSAALAMARRDVIASKLADAKLRLTSLMEHVFPLKSQQPAALVRLKLAAQLAHDLSPQHPPVIQTVLGGGDFLKLRQQLRDNLGQWVELANQQEVVIAIKPHRGGVVSKPADALWLFDQLGKPQRLRMVYDYSHYAFRDLDLAQTVQQSLPYIAHVAVKDAVQEGERVRFCLPGEAGTIDFAQLIRLLHRGGYRGDINCEVSSQVSKQPGYDPIQAAKVCYRNLSPLVK